MTLQSKTSVTLLKILLENRYGLQPEYVPGFAAEPTDDACLLIGDLALEENERHRFAFSYDLGSLWQEWQGLPFVFGAWVISKEALQPRLKHALDSYMERLENGIREFRKNPSMALDLWLKKYPVHLPRPLIEDYFSVLDYRFTDERKQSLALFFKLAAEMGLVESNPPIEFLE